jgi:uncharacterized protein
MVTVIIIHGTGGSPEGNWFPWLKRELESRGHNVLVPPFPTPEGQSLYTWQEAFAGYEYYVQDAVLVGHSLGCAFLLRELDRTHHHARAAFFISAFAQELGLPDFDLLNNSFVMAPFDWMRIGRHCSRFTVINSDDDPYVPLDFGKQVADALGGELVVMHGAKHINAESGHTELPLLLDLIERELKK